MTRTNLSIAFGGLAILPLAVALVQTSLPSIADAVAPAVYGTSDRARVEQRFERRFRLDQYESRHDSAACPARDVC
jgi:parvulin-like peptidyl-prolyl isomerase